MSVIKSYTDTVIMENPISNVTVFNSTKHYEKGEDPYVDAIVEVLFNKTSGKAIKFTFFDQNADKEYEGVRWKP